jgi:hypothetical protein
MVLDDLEVRGGPGVQHRASGAGHGESIVELHRCLARLEAATTRATAAFDAGGEWASDGARTAAA